MHRKEVLLEYLEQCAFINYHNFKLNCRDESLYKYRAYLLVRENIKKTNVEFEDEDNFLIYVEPIIDKIIKDAEMYYLVMEEEGRKNPALYDDNIIRWAIENKFERNKQYYRERIDENIMFKENVKKAIFADIEWVLNNIESASRKTRLFWDTEELKKYSIQFDEDLIYNKETWRLENRYRL